jgi:hypothetical protein
VIQIRTHGSDGEAWEVRGCDPRGLAGLVEIAVGNAPQVTGPEQHRELLADLAARRADHMTRIGEQPGECGDDHLHAGFFDGLPDGGVDGGLTDVDAAPRKFPGPAVTPADQEQAAAEPPRRDEDRRHGQGCGRRRRVTEEHLPGHGWSVDRRHDLACSEVGMLRVDDLRAGVGTILRAG